MRPDPAPARAAIGAAQSIDEVVQAAERARAVPEQLLAAGSAADAVTDFITALNDSVVARVILLTGADAALATAQGCWLAFGSQGRREQTLATDQDNAILFADGGDAESRRRTLLPLARLVNEVLDRCGFPLCRGEVMASNPRWCCSFSEWRECFAQWIDRPEPEALLNATIFFDLRPIHGDRAPVDALREWLAAYASSHATFLLLMAQNALGNQPPLGFLRDFVLASGGEHPNTLDLKVNGVQPFVEAARVYALAGGSTATNTLERLHATARARGLAEADLEGWRRSFSFIQGLRLRFNAAQRARGERLHNHLDPSTLDDPDRRMLKESLRHARKLQQRLGRDFAPAGGAFGA